MGRTATLTARGPRRVRLTRDDALAMLTGEYGYGTVSARGLLVMADKNGTFTDGTVMVSAGRHGYRVSDV